MFPTKWSEQMSNWLGVGTAPTSYYKWDISLYIYIYIYISTHNNSILNSCPDTIQFGPCFYSAISLGVGSGISNEALGFGRCVGFWSQGSIVGG